MGVLSGRDLYSSRYITAEIVDSSKRMHVVPIKYVIGDYFLTEINKQVYCFKIDPSRIMIYRETMTKSFKVIWYTTENYMPISAGDNMVLEEVLRVNGLPKINKKLVKTLKLLGSREKIEGDIKSFPGHSLELLVEEVSKYKNEYSEHANNIINYLQHLNVKQIVTPVKQLSEFLDAELFTTDPKFMGGVLQTWQTMDLEHKKVTNVTITGKTPWLRTILLVSLIGIMGGLGYWAYSSGAFSNFSLGNMFGSSPTDSSIMQQYPTPEALKKAIDEGKVQESSLPPDIRKEVDAIKLPTTPPPAK